MRSSLSGLKWALKWAAGALITFSLMLFSHVPIDVTWLEQFAKEAVDVLDVEVECVAFIAYASVAD